MEQKYYALEKVERKAELYIFGSITAYPWREKDRDSYGIVKQLQDLDVDEIDVYINSTGGSVSEGLAIYNVLKNHKAKVRTFNSGFACSAATVPFMAGDERIVFNSSLFMIHNAWTYASGNAADFRKQADDLDVITQASVKAYMERVNISEEEVKTMMDNETWLSAEQAVEYGFATKIYEEKVEGANQSSMPMIKQKLLHQNTGGIAPVQHPEIKFPSASEIAQEVYGLIKDTIKEKQTNQKKDECSQWAVFFGGKE